MNLNKIAFVASLAVSGIAVSGVFNPAEALTFNVGGTDYDITTVTDTSTNLSSRLQAQPWWGTGSANTISFVNAVGSTFGYPNPGGAGTVRTPYFAFQFQSTVFDTLFLTQGSGLGNVVQSPNTVATYAVINTASVPFDFNPAEGIALGVPLFIGLRILKKRVARK